VVAKRDAGCENATRHRCVTREAPAQDGAPQKASTPLMIFDWFRSREKRLERALALLREQAASEQSAVQAAIADLSARVGAADDARAHALRSVLADALEPIAAQIEGVRLFASRLVPIDERSDRTEARLLSATDTLSRQIEDVRLFASRLEPIDERTSRTEARLLTASDVLSRQIEAVRMLASTLAPVDERSERIERRLIETERALLDQIEVVRLYASRLEPIDQRTVRTEVRLSEAVATLSKQLDALLLAASGLPLIGESVARLNTSSNVGGSFAVPRDLSEQEYASVMRAASLGPGPACLWCKSDDTAVIQKAVSWYGEEAFSVHHCFACSCRFADLSKFPAVNYDGIAARHAWYRLLDHDAEHVANILSSGPDYFWAFMAAKYLNDIPWFPDRRYRAFLAEVFRAAQGGRKLNIIEVGYGRGVAGGIAAHLGHRYTGVDVQTEGRHASQARFGRFGANFVSVAPDWFANRSDETTYDLVFASEVIEHTKDPLGFLARLSSLCCGGGKVILTTPDLDVARLKVWNTDLPPIHTVFLNRRAIGIGIEALRLSAKAVSIANEGMELDWRSVVSADAVASRPGLAMSPGSPQLDPSRDDFRYDVANLDFGGPVMDSFASPEDLDAAYRSKMRVAVETDLRERRASMVVTLEF
jgi:hypothetical protein